MKTTKILVLLLFIIVPVLLNAQGIDQMKLIKDLKYLSSDELAGRAPLTKGNLKARAYIKDRFKELGLTSQYDNYTQFFHFKAEKQIENAANIISFIPGKSTEKIIVITAHYDHIGIKDGEIYNGADDNASGTAALLALAEYFSQSPPEHSMIFAALDAEEMGLQGAKALVKDFPFPLDQVVLNINMDMISRSDKNELYASGTLHNPQLKHILEEAAAGQSVKLMFGHDTPGTGHDDWTNASDHAAFHAQKIPYVYFGVEDHEDYHRPTDTFDKINQEFYFQSVNLILECTKELDQSID